MFEHVLELIERYRQAGVIVDTNLLLVYFVGTLDPRLVGSFKRTETFVLDDYRLLELLLRQFSRILTTPNILTEVSNLSRHEGEPTRSRFFTLLQSRTSSLNEEYIPSNEASQADSFVRFGLADACIHLLAQRELMVLTGDLPLYNYLQSVGIDAVNFNHLRIDAWRYFERSQAGFEV
jgi:rRNA-processing protein FCF1